MSSFEYGYTKGESGLATDQVGGRPQIPASGAIPGLSPLQGPRRPQPAAYSHPRSQMLQSKSAEIEKLLSRLSDVNDSMRSTLSGTADSRSHTLARHRDILHDFTQEFRRLSSIMGAARDRIDLLGNGGGGAGNPLAVQSSQGLLLRERGMLSSANAALDDVMGTATAVNSGLGQQRQLLEGIGGKLMSLGAKFPVVNSLMNAIRRRKNRDNVILAAVVAACTLFVLIYWANK